MLTDLVSALWARTLLPVTVLLAYRCLGVLIQDVGDEYRKVFDQCNGKLLHWWRDQDEPLLKIYEEDIGRCWKSYYQLTKGTREEEAGNKIMLGLYIQIRILQRYLDEAQNAKMGNDLRDIHEGNMVEVIESVMSKLDSKTLIEWQSWMESLVNLDEADWENQVALLSMSWRSKTD